MAQGFKSGGRQKGTPNKVSKAVKDALVAAFDVVGGQDYLVKVALEDPRTFCSMIARLLPNELSGPDGGPIPVTTEIRRTFVDPRPADS